MLFGTAKRLSTAKNFKVFYRFNVINQVNSNVYLGNTIDSSLNLNENFLQEIKDSFWTNAVLAKFRPYLNKAAAFDDCTTLDIL